MYEVHLSQIANREEQALDELPKLFFEVRERTSRVEGSCGGAVQADRIVQV